MASPKEETDAAAVSPPISKTVELNGKQYEPVKEGLAYILKPVDTSTGAKPTPKPRGSGFEQPESVFYNPIQQFNRDLSVLAIKVFSEHFVAAARDPATNRNARRRAKKAKGNGQKRKREDGDGDGDERDVSKKHAGEKQAAEKEDLTASLPLSNTHTDNHANGEEKRVSFKILDALSATGLRALRYAKEIPAATRIVSNDLSESAIEAIKVNIKYNEVESIVRPNVGDARAYLYSLHGENNNHSGHEKIGKFDVIDLDPYGTAGPFLDASIQGLSDGGLLCVTCTDAGVFASTGYPEKAFSLYGGVSVRLPHGHEVGLRLIINAIATTAAKYSLAVEPLLSLSIDYYARVFVRVYRSPSDVKFLSSNTMLVYNCDSGCGAWTTQYLTTARLRPDKKGGMFYHYSLSQAPTASQSCEHCGFKTHLGGPMWGGPLHNPHFIQKILGVLPTLDRETYHTVDRIEGMLTTALEEDLDFAGSPQSQAPETTTSAAAIPEESRPNEPVPTAETEVGAQLDSSPLIPRVPVHLQEKYPFFVNLSAISKVLHVETIDMNSFRGALHGLGYRTTRSHTKHNSVRTDAAWNVIWEIMREWVRQKRPLKPGTLKPGTPGAGIMKNERSKYDPTSALSVLRKEIGEALETGTDMADLTTKIEAALYRRGSAATTATTTSHPSTTAPTAIFSSFTSPTDAPAPSTSNNAKETKAAVTAAAEEKPHPSTLNIVFDEAIGRNFSTSTSSSRKVARYPHNPGENWGPIRRATGR